MIIDKNGNPKRIMGLDISSINTGVAVIEQPNDILALQPIITPPHITTTGDSLLYFQEALIKRINFYKPDFVAIEDIFLGKNPKTYKLLAMYRGITFAVVAHILKTDPISITPSSARKIVGAGKSKQEAFNFIVNKYGFYDYQFSTHNNITDAIIIALAVMMKLNKI